MTIDLQTSLRRAEAIARRAGAALRDAYHKPRHITFKGEINLVTQADEEAERLILDGLRESFPDHAILAEESGASAAQSDYTWVVDPLDGTTNFAHGYPIFAVSMALRGPGGLLLGVVYDPLRNECFTARRGGGTLLNGEPVRVSQETELGRALLATGFAYDRHTASSNTAAFFHVLRRAQGLRRAGAAALDLAYVACGRLDGFWERGLYPWDVAAGILLVREAGGKATDYGGDEESESLYQGSFVVLSNGQRHDEMLAVLAETDGRNS